MMSRQTVELESGTVIITEDQFAIKTDDKIAFEGLTSKEEAEQRIVVCINGVGWPKKRGAYQILSRQRTVVETGWRPVEE